MRKNIKCISEAISFLSDNFFYILRITLPVMLVLAACLTWYAPLAIIPFLLLQGIMFRLLDVKNRGLEVKAQRFRSVYRSGLKNVQKTLNPKVWVKTIKYYFNHFWPFFTLTVCSVFFYGFVAFMISVPQIAILIMKYAIHNSQQLGDPVTLPAGLDWKFYVVLFIINFIISIVLSDCLLAFPLRREECKKEDAEIDNIIPKKK